jgi:hypothetical protein
VFLAAVSFQFARVALKIQREGAPSRQMDAELEFLSLMQGTPGFPSIIFAVNAGELKCLAVDVVARPLSHFVGRLTELQASKIRHDMQAIVTEAHKRGWAIGDINLGAFGISSTDGRVVLLDSGGAYKFDAAPSQDRIYSLQYVPVQVPARARPLEPQDDFFGVDRVAERVCASIW